MGRNEEILIGMGTERMGKAIVELQDLERLRGWTGELHTLAGLW